MIPWKYPKRGEVPEEGRVIIELFEWSDVHRREMSETEYHLQYRFSPGCLGWCYADEFPWPETLEDEKSEGSK